MPTYVFQCNCGLRFEASNSIKRASEPRPCPSCQKQAPRMMPSNVHGVFHQPVTGPGPQNTGIASLDVHIDRVIGQSAAQGWEQVEQRVKEKRQLVAEGAPADAISRNPDGSYRVMAPEERGVFQRANQINDKANRTLRPKAGNKPSGPQ